MKEITTKITINATVEKVWSILTDFEHYPEWNPFIQKLEGDVKEGKRIEIKIVPEGSKGMSFKPIVLKADENNELRWVGHVLFKGLFDGEHSLKLEANSDGTTTFIQSERFTGVFVFLFNVAGTKAGFETMNKKIKELAEK